MTFDTNLLTPAIEGEETYEISAEGGVFCPSGSGFDRNNPQHSEGSDTVRYAIALQQLRDAGRFDESDQVRDYLSERYFVMQERNGTRLIAHPFFWSEASLAHRNFYRPFIRVEIFEGIMNASYVNHPSAPAWLTVPL